MIVVPFVGLLIGAAMAMLLAKLQLVGPIGGWQGNYLAVACLAGLDTVCGGIRSGLEGKFHVDVFVTGFFSNVLIAFLLAWLGDMLFADLYLAVTLVLGARIFTNLSLIRRFALTKWQDNRERTKQQAALASSQMQADTTQ